jgi:hypothetical protein
MDPCPVLDVKEIPARKVDEGCQLKKHCINTKRGEEMQNVKWEVKDDKLIIEIDLTKEFGPSKSGKTITIASTRGNQKIEGTDVVIGLNVYKYPETV